MAVKAVRPSEVTGAGEAAPAPAASRRLWRAVTRHSRYLTLAPVTLYMAGFLGVPLVLAIVYSLTDISTSTVGMHFVGLSNFIALVSNPVFIESLKVTAIYGGASTVLTALLGTGMAFVMLPSYRGKRVIRFVMTLPWTIPIALSLVGWQWIFSPQFSVINWIADQFHLMGQPGVQWLGFPSTAMTSVVTANVWHNMPFAAIIFVAAIIGVPQDLIDAAKVDGASWWARLTKVVLPVATPILLVGLAFNMVFNFTDLTVVYLLSEGGPGNSTTVLSYYAFEVGISSGDLAQGAAITLFLLPFLVAMSVVFLRAVRKSTAAIQS